jgi:flavin reductase (DIM6/NTAB) family NADH-FMN oxidoreductase RutF
MVDSDWKPGDAIASPVDRMISLDLTTMASTPAYKLLIGAIVPRPIAFVSTVSPEGVGNLAPFSFFNGVSSVPPAIMIAITRRNDGSKKDTLRNIEATRQFVVNSVAEWLVEPMNHCSADYPYGVDEMRKVGLTPLPSLRVKPPRVKESPIQMECELYDTMEVGPGVVGSSTIVVGKILQMHVHEPAYDNGRLRLEAIQPISRLAGASYGRTTETFDLARPKV